MMQCDRFSLLSLQVYDGAACLAKYLESLMFVDPPPDGGCLKGKRLIELGAGTGGLCQLLSAYYILKELKIMNFPRRPLNNKNAL